MGIRTVSSPLLCCNPASPWRYLRRSVTFKACQNFQRWDPEPVLLRPMHTRVGEQQDAHEDSRSLKAAMQPQTPVHPASAEYESGRPKISRVSGRQARRKLSFVKPNRRPEGNNVEPPFSKSRSDHATSSLNTQQPARHASQQKARQDTKHLTGQKSDKDPDLQTFTVLTDSARLTVSLHT